MDERDTSRIRLSMVGIVCISLFAALLARLYYLQVIDKSGFEVQAARVHLRVVHEEGPRGRILDRNGRVLVDNRVSIVAGLDRSVQRKLAEGDRAALFDRLATTLTSFGVPTKSASVQAAFDDKRYGPLELVPVASDLDPSVELYLAEHADQFPGVEVRRRAVRVYPYGSLAAHLVGYVGQINAEELAAHQQAAERKGAGAGADELAKPYQTGDEIGKAGVEATYEAELRGVPSDRTIQVDARGDYLSTVKESSPRAGEDVWLTIDVNVQAMAEQMLRQQLDALKGKTDKDGKVLRAPQGSVVIEDPTNGQIVAMASYPTYEPTDLVNGISSELWARLNDEGSGQPFFNWALQGTYAPGSTFKLITGTAGLERGFLRPGNDKYYDTGTYKVPDCRGEKCTFSNAGSEPHGMVEISRALTVSSDVFFYWIGDRFWQDRGMWGETPIQDVGATYGLGQPTGVPLPGEGKGRLPTPAQLKAAHDANPGAFPRDKWYTGDSINMSVGQGDVLVTPLQLVNAYATFANGGTRWVPQVVSRVTRPIDVGRGPSEQGNYEVVREVAGQAAGQVTFTGGNRTKILTGLQGVVTSPSGTANGAYSASRTAWPMAGKTGTAQVQGKADTSLFVAFGPTPAPTPPRYAISVVIPEAGFGGDVAAPLAFRIMKPISDGTVPIVVPATPAAEAPG